MKTKIRKIGNSAGIIIPKEVRKETGLKLGDAVMVGMHGHSIIISPQKKKRKKDITNKFVKMVDEFITEHEDVLEELAKK